VERFGDVDLVPPSRDQLQLWILNTMNRLILFLLLSVPLLALGQDTPQAIAKKDLPKEAECAVCTANGSAHGAEKPAAGMLYKGKAFYFCSAKEVEAFKKSPESYVPLELPMVLPELQLKDTTGKLWNSVAFKGRLVLLDYWATWCKPCLQLKPKLDKIRDAYKSMDFEILSISIDEKKATLDKFLTKATWPNPVLWDDNNSWAKLRIAAIPALFLVKDGQIIAAFKGNVDPKVIEEAVKANLK
jgi:thiol-disulfide isomerase/thioredoxin